MPGIHPFYYIGTDALNHTKEYTEAAGKAALVYWEQMLFVKIANSFREVQPSPSLSRSATCSVLYVPPPLFLV